MAAIKIRGLSKAFATEDASRPALVSLDLDVAEGELLVVVGPSGCGKSTALRLIAGLDEPTSGSIELGGRDLCGVAPQDRDVAMVFQGYALYPHLNVRDNIAFPLKMRGEPKGERTKRVKKVAELVGLSDKLGRYVAELSGGERQRVAMGRAIVRRPQAFLFDEPLSNLDAQLRAELRVELVSLVRRLGTTAIYVTHDQAEAMTMGDRVAVLHAGELQQVAPPRTVYEEPANAFVAGFVGTPAMNLVTLECDDGRGHGGGVTVELPASLADRGSITVGFRPEHIALGARAGELEQGAACLTAEVTAVEPLGPETLVYLAAGEAKLRARVEGFGGPEPGLEIEARVAPGHLQWFDADSGERIGSEG